MVEDSRLMVRDIEGLDGGGRGAIEGGWKIRGGEVD